MSRIPKIEIDQATGETKKVFDEIYQERGNVPNMFRTVAHRPEILRTLAAHLRAIMDAPGCSKKLKELVIVRASQINRCEY